MRILHLVSYSLFSGPVPSTLGLALAQREAGHEVWLGHDTKRGRINDFEESADPWIEACGLGMHIAPQTFTVLNCGGVAISHDGHGYRLETHHWR